MSTKSLKVAFPFSVLNKKETLFNPRNTATIWEYYLLENLGVGLLRDNLADTREYAPGLAIAWSQTLPTIWSFEIRKGISWSDGTPMELSAMAAFYRKLKNTPSRHISHLKLLDDIEVDEARRLLHFRFHTPMGRGILHELSLADTVYLHPSNTESGWYFGSGPFVVESYNPEEMKLVLTRNPYSIEIFGDAGPSRVELFWTKEADFAYFFTDLDADIFTSGAFSFRKKVNVLDRLPITKISGNPTAIYYLEIDPQSGLGTNPNIRQAFAEFFQNFFRRTPLASSLTFEDQLIPSGYQARLPSKKRSVAALDTAVLKGMAINIALFPQMEELHHIFDKLSVEASINGFSLHFDYGLKCTEPCFARTEVFKGNQRDASGTWSFLLSNPNNYADTLNLLVKNDLEDLLSSIDEEKRAAKSAIIHRKVLESALIIPFMIENVPVYTRQNIDLSHWNIFDMRLRFYDVRWK